MSYEHLPDGSPVVRYDLSRGFDNLALSDQGVLEISPRFSKQIMCELGGEVIAIARLSFPNEDNADPMAVHNAYTITNPWREHATILISDEPMRTADQDVGEYTTYRGQEIIIGRETTPELELGHTASREHMSLRLGTFQQHVHFQDLDSTNGTSVLIAKEDERFVNSSPRKLYSTDLPGHPAKVVIDQHWIRG